MKKNIIIILLFVIIVVLVVFIFSGKRIVFHDGMTSGKNVMAENHENTNIESNEVNNDEKADILINDNALIAENYTIVIDPGHQSKGNSNQEPVAPGASETKAKVSSGTTGIATRIPEYEVNLQVSLKLKDILVNKGYNVIMTRETNEIDISNSERAQIANNSSADAFIRIHCNGSENSNISGALAMCQTKNNKYCGNLYSESRSLSESVLDGLCNETNANKQGISETDSMSGINWSQVPVTIIEMGYMTNYEEDKLLCSDEYQRLLSSGIAKGIENYFIKMLEEENN